MANQINYYQFPPSVALKHKLSDINEANKKIDTAKSLGKQDLWLVIQNKLRIEWTHDSNAIEGSTLTKGDTYFFLQEGLTVEGKPLKDFLDARNHAEAIDFLYEVITDQRPISVSLIKDLNALLLSGVTYTPPAMNELGQKIRKPASPGQLKMMPNQVLQPDSTIHQNVEPLKVAEELERLCA